MSFTVSETTRGRELGIILEKICIYYIAMVSVNLACSKHNFVMKTHHKFFYPISPINVCICDVGN